MPKEYTKEQLWKLYEKLPGELKEAIFSEETADNIWDICERNEVERISEIAKLVGNVLLGILPPEDFQETIEKELRFNKDLAKRITHEINRFIFYPVKGSLAEIYKIEAVSPTKPPVGPHLEITPPTEEKAAPSKPDTYRELIE